MDKNNPQEAATIRHNPPSGDAAGVSLHCQVKLKTLSVMIRYKLRLSTLKEGPAAGKWYAYAVNDETYDLDKLSEHMADHNSPYSAGMIKGVLTDMVACIKELLLDGKSVKVDDLAIFSVGLRGTGVENPDDYSATEHVTGVRLRARATGKLSTTNLKLSSKLKHQNEYVKPGTDPETDPTTPGGSGGTDTGGEAGEDDDFQLG